MAVVVDINPSCSSLFIQSFYVDKVVCQKIFADIIFTCDILLDFGSAVEAKGFLFTIS